MDSNVDQPTQGKDLQHLTNMSWVPAVSFLRKAALPSAPTQSPPVAFQKLGIFSASNIWQWLRDYLRYRIGPRHPFATYDNPAQDNGVYALRGDDGAAGGPIRVALAGDWGTGTDEAYKVASKIEEFRAHYTIHLGDVYFVGDVAEVKENFLGIADDRHSYTPCRWPIGSNGAFALNGNHEMYARGLAYFQLILPALGLVANGKPQGQKASFFCLQNEHWRIVGLDTGYNSIGIPFIENFIQPECALPPEVVTWLREIVFQADDGRGIVLLGHHQYYSAFDSWYTKQAEQMAPFIRRPVLWFWGHEHRLAIYKSYNSGGGIEAYGRCIGHGGMPIDLPPSTQAHSECEIEFVDRRKYHNDEKLDVGMNGHVELTFDADKLKVDYVDIEGATIFAEAWQVDRAGRIDRVSAGPVQTTTV